MCAFNISVLTSMESVTSSRNQIYGGAILITNHATSTFCRTINCECRSCTFSYGNITYGGEVFMGLKCTFTMHFA